MDALEHGYIYRNYKNYKHFEEEKFKIIYNNEIISNVNTLKLIYVLENYKNIKYDFIINKDNYIVIPKIK